MFRTKRLDVSRGILMALLGLLVLSGTAMMVTIWLMVELEKEQEIIAELVTRLPSAQISSVEELPGELRWQFWLSTVVLLNGVASAIAVIVLLRAYMTSERSLRDVRVLARDILASMDQGVITTDRSGVITSINARGLELLGIVTGCVGKKIGEISDEALGLGGLYDAVVATHENVLDRHATVDMGGHTRTFRMDGHLLRDANQCEMGTVIHVRDVTVQFLMEGRMRRMERYMGLGSLAAGLHHEIKNPLSALSLHVQLLEEELNKGKTSSEIDEFVGVLRTEITRICGVLEEFRNFASVSSSAKAPTDPKGVLQRIVHLIRPQAESQTVSVTVEQPAPELPQISLDAAKFEQVLLNLIVNALAAMPDGGVLTVRTAVADQELRIGISDTGQGIPDEFRSRVFEPYFTTKSEGTGMGLALSEKIVAEHGGNIEFRTSTEGTVFEIVLPLDQEA